MADQRFDSGAAPELAFDGAEDTTLLSRDEDPSRVGRIVAAVSFVDISALDSQPVRRWAPSMAWRKV